MDQSIAAFVLRPALLLNARVCVVPRGEPALQILRELSGGLVAKLDQRVVQRVVHGGSAKRCAPATGKRGWPVRRAAWIVREGRRSFGVAARSELVASLCNFFLACIRV